MVINAQMDIPDGRTIAANWALQLSLLAFVINLMSVPYNAVIIAHERMSVFALISILEVTLKLAVVFVLKWILFDKLITYACLTTLVALIIRTVYAVYCKRHFEESRFKFTFDKGLLCDMLGFTGWAFGEIRLSYSKTRSERAAQLVLWSGSECGAGHRNANQCCSVQFCI